MASSTSKRRNHVGSQRARMLIDDEHENLLHRSIPKHNLVRWLRDRELGYRKSRVNRAMARRTSVYRAVHPSYSILMCTVPQAVYIRRFSPNGQYLLAFSHDLESLIVYSYKGRFVVVVDSYPGTSADSASLASLSTTESVITHRCSRQRASGGTKLLPSHFPHLEIGRAKQAI